MTDAERDPNYTGDVEMDVPHNEDGVSITPFTAVAAVMPRNPLDELSIELNKMVKLVADTEAKSPTGKITLTLTVERSTKTIGAVIITPEIVAKPPKEPKYGALLFADDDGVLSTRNKDQGDMFEGPDKRKRSI